MNLLKGTSALFNTIVNMDFDEGFALVKPWWDKILDQRESTTKNESYASVERMIRLSEWAYGDTRKMGNTSHLELTVSNKRFSAALDIPVDEFEDDRYGLYQEDVRLMGAAAADWKNDLALDFLENGNSATYYPTVDGKAFFATDHPQIAGDGTGSQANSFSLMPLTFDNFVTGLNSLRALKAADGRPAKNLPVQLKLVVPLALQFVAKQILFGDNVVRSSAQSGSGSLFGSVSNPIVGDFEAELIVLNTLSSATTWFMFDTFVGKPGVLQVRKEPELRVHLSGESAEGDDADVHSYRVKARGAVAPTKWYRGCRFAA